MSWRDVFVQAPVHVQVNIFFGFHNSEVRVHLLEEFLKRQSLCFMNKLLDIVRVEKLYPESSRLLHIGVPFLALSLHFRDSHLQALGQKLAKKIKAHIRANSRTSRTSTGYATSLETRA